MKTDFQNSFTAVFPWKFPMYLWQRLLPHLNYVATLPREIWKFKIAVFQKQPCCVCIISVTKCEPVPIKFQQICLVNKNFKTICKYLYIICTFFVNCNVIHCLHFLPINRVCHQTIFEFWVVNEFIIGAHSSVSDILARYTAGVLSVQ